MNTGQDPREGLFISLGLIVTWLLAVTYSITLHTYICHLLFISHIAVD